MNISLDISVFVFFRTFMAFPFVDSVWWYYQADDAIIHDFIPLCYRLFAIIYRSSGGINPPSASRFTRG